MKAISLWQPWATLLVAGEKQIETRCWFMYHRGPLLIHAARKWDKTLAAMCNDEPFKSALARLGVTWGVAGKPWMPSLPFGAIVGKVLVSGCFKTEMIGKPFVPLISATERAFGDYSHGRFLIQCTDFVRFENPLPFAGRQGLFDILNPMPLA